LRCAACDTELRPVARFCDACGAPQEHRTPAPARSPRDYTPPHLARRILRQRSALEGEHKQVTVLFLDVKGSMGLAEAVDLETWHRIMNRFFQIVSGVIHGFEGTINQFTGDGVMALFGAPIAHEDHAQRACHAALSLRDELSGYAEELQQREGLAFSVRMGLNSGEVVVGRIGDDLRMDYTAQGHTVGLAARMEQLAEPGSILLTAHTAALAAGFFRLRDLGEFAVRGASEPLRVHALEGTGALVTRFDASRSRGLARFVGRRAELGLLDAALAQATAGRGRVLGIVGEAGVGKSRLCFEFVERCRAGSVLVRTAHAVAHGRMIPFLPLLGMLRDLFGIAEETPPAEARERITGVTLALDGGLERRLPLLFEFLGVSPPGPPSPHLDPEARQRQLVDCVMHLVRARGRREPAVFVFEDVHWLDAGSESFLERLVEIACEARTLVLVNFRPGYRADWMESASYSALSLEPLDEPTLEELLDDLLGPDSGDTPLRRLIRQRTAGNPFFVEELVRSLREAGSLGALEQGPGSAGMDVPPTVQAVLAARIDRLSELEKRVLQTAAVVGKSFTETLLCRVLELPEAELRAVLGSLVAARFLRQTAPPPAAEYAFEHPLTLEVAYASQLAEPRAGIHAAVLEALAAVSPERHDENAAVLARHAEAAGWPLEAARWHRRAAEWVGIRDVEAAHRHWRAALELAARAPEGAERDALELQGYVWLQQLAWRLGFSREEAQDSFTRGVALAERSGDRHARVALALGYAVYRGVVGDEAGQHRHAEQAAEAAEALGSPPLALAARAVMATSLHFQGRLREAIAAANHALAQWPGAGDRVAEEFGLSPATYLLGLRGQLHALCGRFADGARDLGRALELARESGDAEALGCVHGFAVQYAWCAGLEDAALAHAQQMLDVAERTGIPLLQVDAYLALGNALEAGGCWNDAADAFERALEIVTARRILLGQRRRVLAGMAEARLGRGEWQRARAMAEPLAASARQSGTLLVELRARLVIARAALQIEGAAAGETVHREVSRGVELVETSDARSFEPELHRVLAELARQEGEDATRRRHLNEARRLRGRLRDAPPPPSAS
jgi:class 3 adenylate cyclase/tetratricopeptide (TPR) repeat protein